MFTCDLKQNNKCYDPRVRFELVKLFPNHLRWRVTKESKDQNLWCCKYYNPEADCVKPRSIRGDEIATTSLYSTIFL